MTEWHGKSRRKPSGGIRTSRRRRDKRLAEKGGTPALTEIGDKEKRTKARGRGFTEKVKQKKARFAAVTNPKTNKTEKAEILSVEENNANRLFVRRNIITRGAVIAVRLGGKEEKARVTSRPSQQGQVQAVLLGGK
jgi:small subunit ribosomal protein S8e